jgi:hypothetical protein
MACRGDHGTLSDAARRSAPCIGWIATDGAVIVGAIVYG